ncbi:hypothetical protein LFML04_0959 [Leptospirillum ferriphilum ML-04]|uniref:Uncharacterized protein n=1 Tax=Leptospirillum ferriphilum (strain ML-04) TaxID=1048260 RepID=J9ZAM2_LEPFM|nr:hypothetical protein LFML04_0959 [Leptospirillum ferriphilum ML-04]
MSLNKKKDHFKLSGISKNLQMKRSLRLKESKREIRVAFIAFRKIFP